jgi:hypothetical protein
MEHSRPFIDECTLVIMNQPTKSAPDIAGTSNKDEVRVETSLIKYGGAEEPRISVWALLVLLAVVLALTCLVVSKR